MRRLSILVVLVALTAHAQGSRRNHPDYVPDQKTAERVAEAILIGQFGEERVKAQFPLVVDGSDKRYWIVQVHGDSEAPSFGGGYAVWIDKHSGCIRLVTESMK